VATAAVPAADAVNMIFPPSSLTLTPEPLISYAVELSAKLAVSPTYISSVTFFAVTRMVYLVLPTVTEVSPIDLPVKVISVKAGCGSVCSV